MKEHTTFEKAWVTVMLCVCIISTFMLGVRLAIDTAQVEIISPNTVQITTFWRTEIFHYESEVN